MILIITYKIKINDITENITNQYITYLFLDSKGRGMCCAYVTHLRLTNSKFCVLCIRINYFEAHLIDS